MKSASITADLRTETGLYCGHSRSRSYDRNRAAYP
jgi:hypothetical protein